MAIHQFFYNFLIALAVVIAASVGILGTAAVLQDHAQVTEQVSPQEKQLLLSEQPAEATLKMVTTGDRTQAVDEPETEQTKSPKKTKKFQNPQSRSVQALHKLHIKHVSYSQPTNHSTLDAHYQVIGNQLRLVLPKSLTTQANLKRALTRLLLSDRLIPEEQLFSKAPIQSHKVPFFYGKVLNQEGKPMRYPSDVYRFVNHILAHPEAYLHEAKELTNHLVLSLPMKKQSISDPIHQYQHWVDEYADQFSVNPALVFAIMETESGFNPKAVSGSNALGLMQLKPASAGQDVYRHIDFKEGVPEAEVLFDSKNNIRMGTAYLGLLQNEYLSQIRNRISKKILAIAAYNGGLSTVLKLFGKDKESAIERINRLNPKQIYRKLRQQHQSAETRAYVEKVLRAERKYQQILG